MSKSKYQLIASLDDFTRAYIDCMLWSSTDMADDSGGAPLYDNYGVEDITLAALRSIVADCKAFQEDNAELLAKAASLNLRYTISYAGDDFWLTRNRHGAGFWDRGLGEAGDKLTKAAKVYGSQDPMVSRGKIYL